MRRTGKGRGGEEGSAQNSSKQSDHREYILRMVLELE